MIIKKFTFILVLRRSHEGLLESDGYHSNSEQSSTKSANHHHRHNRHHFHQVHDWTGQDVFSHPGQPNVFTPAHEENRYVPHHGSSEEHHHGYREIPERQSGDGGVDDQSEVPGHIPGHYHYQHLYHYAAYYRFVFYTHLQQLVMAKWVGQLTLVYFLTWNSSPQNLNR